VPWRVIWGSTACRTITKASKSGILMHTSSPKHLGKYLQSQHWRASVFNYPPARGGHL
jgi:hypothetical protein